MLSDRNLSEWFANNNDSKKYKFHYFWAKESVCSNKIKLSNERKSLKYIHLEKLKKEDYDICDECYKMSSIYCICGYKLNHKKMKCWNCAFKPYKIPFIISTTISAIGAFIIAILSYFG